MHFHHQALPQGWQQLQVKEVITSADQVTPQVFQAHLPRHHLIPEDLQEDQDLRPLLLRQCQMVLVVLPRLHPHQAVEDLRLPRLLQEVSEALLLHLLALPHQHIYPNSIHPNQSIK